MSEHEQMYPKPTRELAEQRKRLAPKSAEAFKVFSQNVFAEGAIPAKTKQLIAVAVAHVTQCPYCINGHTKAAIQHGATPEEIMEAIWVAVEMRRRCLRAFGVSAGHDRARAERRPDMSIKVAINGLGRIRRTILKLAIDEPSIELVAVNDLIDAENLAYLLRFDTVYGRFSKSVAVEEDQLVVAGRKLRTLHSRDPVELPWKGLGIDLVFECTGAHTRREDLEKHIRAALCFVLLSAPAKDEEVDTLIHGVNAPGQAAGIISCASCTTNCITPIVEIIGRRIGFRKAVMTTVHAYTSSQSLVDGPNKRFRRGRSAAANLVPATTGAARATTRALPQYAGLFDGVAIRAPIPVGSIADITFLTSRPTTADEVNQILSEESDSQRYVGVLGVSRDPLVSSDIIGDPRASIVDLELTKVVDGDLVKVMSWYDNEYGYANQMIRQAVEVIESASFETTGSPSRADERRQGK